MTVKLFYLYNMDGDLVDISTADLSYMASEGSTVSTKVFSDEAETIVGGDLASHLKFLEDELRIHWTTLDAEAKTKLITLEEKLRERLGFQDTKVLP